VAEAGRDPPPQAGAPVQAHIAFAEEDLRQPVKPAGGRWRPETKTWDLPSIRLSQIPLSSQRDG